MEAIMKDYPNPKPLSRDPPDFMLSDDPQFDKLKEYARNLPYPVESNAYMQELLDFILKR
jgi:proteasome activator subunit 4